MVLGIEYCHAFLEPIQFGCRNHQFCMAADQTDEDALTDVDGALIYIFDTGKTSGQFRCELSLTL
jgi:hypothetical protein